MAAPRQKLGPLDRIANGDGNANSGPSASAARQRFKRAGGIVASSIAMGKPAATATPQARKKRSVSVIAGLAGMPPSGSLLEGMKPSLTKPRSPLTQQVEMEVEGKRSRRKKKNEA